MIKEAAFIFINVTRKETKTIFQGWYANLDYIILIFEKILKVEMRIKI